MSLLDKLARFSEKARKDLREYRVNREWNERVVRLRAKFGKANIAAMQIGHEIGLKMSALCDELEAMSDAVLELDELPEKDEDAAT